ncbi:MAG: DUF134 domain-containing protein [Bacteroidales bacterium]|nr:DUF134 domain-containing protein [Bacteroidales bacterium]
MPRPQKNRIVLSPPLFKEFKPTGLRNKSLEKTILLLDEYEAFRLSDFQGLSHAEAAKQMKISRSTFSRLIETTRKKIASALVQGKTLRILGGNVHFKKNIIHCQNCKSNFDIQISSLIHACPNCQSDQLENLADNFGHGNCCT